MWHAINWHILNQQRSCKDKQTEKKINIAEFILEYLKQKQKIYIFKQIKRALTANTTSQ